MPALQPGTLAQVVEVPSILTSYSEQPIRVTELVAPSLVAWQQSVLEASGWDFMSRTLGSWRNIDQVRKKEMYTYDYGYLSWHKAGRALDLALEYKVDGINQMILSREDLGEQVYWRMGDPLYLTEANERHLEHMSRVAYADLRFAEPSVGLRGWNTERGVTYIRYGPPETIASFPLGTASRAQVSADVFDSGVGDVQDSRSTTTGYTLVWVYERGFALMFHKEANYRHTPYAGEYTFVASEIRHELPAKYDNIPSLPMMLPAIVKLPLV